MPAEESGPKQTAFVLRLSGQITVQFVNGQSLTGEFMAQDLWNIFLRIDNQPVMIPRGQILYLTGEAGQGIERDSSLEDYKPESKPVDASDASLFETADMRSSDPLEETLVETDDFQDSEGGTFVVQPEPVQATTDSETPAFPPDEVDDGPDSDRTFVIDETADLERDQAEAVGFVFSAEGQPPIESETDWDDRTVVLHDEEEDDEDEITYILETEEEARPPAQLICTTGPHAGEQFTLSGQSDMVGRARDNAIALSRDKEVSRRHAVIKQEGGQFVIQDQNSLNGTFVNSERVVGVRPLKDGDIILIGVSDLEFHE